MYNVIHMYNLLEYSHNYSMTSGSLWNYFKDEIDEVDDNASDGKWFWYKKNSRRHTRKTTTSRNPGDVDQPPQLPVPSLKVEITLPLEYSSNFWKSLDLPLINCDVELDLLWKNVCVLMSIIVNQA